MNQLLSYLLARDYSFYITNPENSNEFCYNKKIRQKNNHNRSKTKQNDGEVENSSRNEIKNIISTRPGMVLLNSLILSGVILIFNIITGLFLSVTWPVYSYVIVYMSASIIIFKILDRNFYGINLYYKLEGGKEIFYEILLDSFYELSDSKKIWHVDSISPNNRMNYHGGSKEIYDRHVIKAVKSLPRFIRTKTVVWTLEVKNGRLFFFPDFIVLENRKKYSVLEYETLSIEYIEKPYYESDKDPDDATIIGTTWLHPRKGGGPDKRFRKNHEISIILYGEIKISDQSGNLFHFQISNLKNAYRFYKFVALNSIKYTEVIYSKSQKSEKFRQNKKTNTGNESSEKEKSSNFKPDMKDEIAKSYRLLGLQDGAPILDIKTAYYLMAKKYHPDLVTNKKLFRDFEEKMKEINKAYEILKK